MFCLIRKSGDSIKPVEDWINTESFQSLSQTLHDVRIAHVAGFHSVEFGVTKVTVLSTWQDVSLSLSAPASLRLTLWSAAEDSCFIFVEGVGGCAQYSAL